MTGEEFTPQVGDLVDVTVTGATLFSRNAQELTLTDEGGYAIAVPRGFARVTLAPGTPREWPPQPGDVWADATGSRFFVIGELDDVWLVDAAGHRNDLDDFDRIGDGMQLVSRHGWTPPAAETSVPAAANREPPQLGARAKLVQSLRALAQYLEDTPQLEVGSTADGAISWAARGSDDAECIAGVRAAAALLGVEVDSDTIHRGHRHWRAKRKFGAIDVRVTHVEDALAEPAAEGGEQS